MYADLYKLRGTLPSELAGQNPKILFVMLDMLGEKHYEASELPPSLGWMAGL